MECSKSSSKRDIHSSACLPSETRKFQVNSLTSHLKELEIEQTKPKISRRKAITKVRVEINEIIKKQ